MNDHNYEKFSRDMNSLKYFSHVIAIEFGMCSSSRSTSWRFIYRHRERQYFQRFVVFSHYSTDNLTWKGLFEKEKHPRHAMICQWRVRHHILLIIISLLFTWCISYACCWAKKIVLLTFAHAKTNKKRGDQAESISSSTMSISLIDKHFLLLEWHISRLQELK